MNSLFNNSTLKRLLTSFLLVMILQNIYSQDPEKIYVQKGQTIFTFYQWVNEVNQENDIRIFFNPDSIPDLPITLPEIPTPLPEYLKSLFAPSTNNISYDNQGNIFITGSQALVTTLDRELFLSNEQKQNIQEVEDRQLKKFLEISKNYASKTIVFGKDMPGLNKQMDISGTVLLSEENTPIVNATLFIEELNMGTTSDENGNFSFSLPKGRYTLSIKSLETEDESIRIIVKSSAHHTLFLNPKLFLLEEFMVGAERVDNVRGTQMGFEKLSIKKVSQLPTVMGERDIVKIALLLPGVETIGEGSVGFNVRGSPADQNIFYVNDAVICNPSHLFGFFSSFNADALNEFSLSKSNIPIKYGGRLSSVFDISVKKGNPDQFSARGGISPITTNIMAEGPLVKNHSSYLLSLRSTYSDWIFKLIKDEEISKSQAYFGDGLLNLSWKLNPKNELNFFTYYSYDDAKIASLTNNTYTNFGSSLNWKHYFKQKHSLDLSFTKSDFAYDDINTDISINGYQQSYQLGHTELKGILKLNLNEDHQTIFGVNSILYEVNRGDFLPADETSLIEHISFEPEKGLESAIFAGDTWEVFPFLEVYAGIRFNHYRYLGPKTVYEYVFNNPLTPQNIIDTLFFGKNQTITYHNGLDYRASIRYMLSENLSVKASYNRLHQYIFLLSNTIAISPTDRWKLSDYHIDPLVGDQFAIGFYSDFPNSLIEASVETYYKTNKNLVEYKDGAELIVNEIPETEIVQGSLKAYGIELMLKKPYGKLNGWVNYAYSRALVEVDNEVTGEQNNFGIPYPANYDKPHSFNLVLNYKKSKRLTFSGTIVYSTGRPITYPAALYFLDGQEITHYSLRNEYRLPDYFRVDASISLEGNLKAKKFAHGSWMLSVYNLTGRKNAYSVYFKSNNGILQGYKLSVFGFPIFSITYNFKLGNYEN